MKASELVRLLNEEIEKNGDLEVCTWIDQFNAPCEIGKPSLEIFKEFKYIQI